MNMLLKLFLSAILDLLNEFHYENEKPNSLIFVCKKGENQGKFFEKHRYKQFHELKLKREEVQLHSFFSLYFTDKVK